jgi:hypothetical protein
MQGHGLPDGLGDFQPAFPEYRVVVPLTGFAVEVGGVESGGLSGGHDDAKKWCSKAFVLAGSKAGSDMIIMFAKYSCWTLKIFYSPGPVQNTSGEHPR